MAGFGTFQALAATALKSKGLLPVTATIIDWNRVESLASSSEKKLSPTTKSTSARIVRTYGVMRKPRQDG